MLNSSSISHGGNASLNLKINAVSGSLVKNHAKSFFVKVNADSEEGRILFSNSPMWLDRKYFISSYKNRYGDKQYRIKERSFVSDGSCVLASYSDCEKNHWKPVQVLQAMFLGDNNFFCEVVYEDDLVQENEE